MPRPYPTELYPVLSNDNLVARRPLHLTAGMGVIAGYSQLEAILSRLLTTMLGANPSPAAAIYQTLRSAHAQKSALSAVAAQVLSNEDNKLVRYLLSLIKSASDARDEIAHRIWLFDEKFTDAVVLYDPNQIWRMSVEISQKHSDGTATLEEAQAMQDAMRKASKIWTLQDFETARLDGVYAFVAATALSNAFAAPMNSAERRKEQMTFENTLQQAAKPKP